MSGEILRARSDELCDVLYDFIKEVSNNEYFRDPSWKEMFEAHIMVGRFLNFSIRKDKDFLIEKYLDE